MKYVFLLTLTAFIFLAGCEKNDDSTPGVDLPNGLYVGNFSRTGMDTAEVSLNLINGKFGGSASGDLYPAICGGTFTTTGSFVDFEDSCTWTADFDWSLILDGRYNVDFTENMLRIWRTENDRTDEYYLRRMVR